MTTTEQSMVVGSFEDRAKAEQAVAELQQAGFRADQISLSKHGAATEDGFLAGLKSLFSGHETATTNVSDDLAGMGMPAEDASYYQREYEAGRSIVAVTGESRMQQAAAILTHLGASGANRQSAQTPDDGFTVRTAAQESVADMEGERRMQLREEQLRVYTQPVQTGEVRLGKKVMTEQQTLTVPVTHEEVYIERRPASGQISDTPIGKGESIDIPVMEEHVTTSKQTIETGEVSLGKRQVQETQRVTDTVRREEARIEREGNVTVRGDTNVDDVSR